MGSITLNEKERQKQYILTGNLWKVMANISWPAIIAMVLYGFNTVLDAIFVGQFVGETAVAGVSLAYPITQLSTGLGSLVGVGAGSLLSIALGANDKETQRKLLGNVNVLCLLVTAVYMVLAFVFAPQLVTFMGGEGEALALGVEYFRITVLGSLFWVYGLAANMIIRAEGKMKSAAWMMGTGLAANALANYILMGPLNMGVAGAAWGTNFGMLVYSVVGWVYFARKKATFDAKVASLRLDGKIIKSILGLGASSLIMTVMSLVQAVVVFNALANYGTTADVAFYGVVYRVFQFCLTPIFGLMRALQPVLGINYGAGQMDRVIRSYKIFSVAALVLTLPFWLISLVAPGAILGTMLPGQLFTAAQLGSFRLYMSILPLLSFIFMAMTLFPSVDKGAPAALIGMARQLVLYVPVMLLVPRLLGVFGVYIGSVAIDTLIVLITLLMVKREFTGLRRKKAAQAENLKQTA